MSTFAHAKLLKMALEDICIPSLAIEWIWRTLKSFNVVSEVRE